MGGKGSKIHLEVLLVLALLIMGNNIKVSADECCKKCVALCGCVGCKGASYPCLLHCFRNCPFLCIGMLKFTLFYVLIHTYQQYVAKKVNIFEYQIMFDYF